MKEWAKHLERAEEKLGASNLLFENIDIYYVPSKEEAESVIEDAERFLERIKKAIEVLYAFVHLYLHSGLLESGTRGLLGMGLGAWG